MHVAKKENRDGQGGDMAMTRAEYDRPHIPQKDFYTVQDIYSAAEVVRLLGSSRSRFTTTRKTR